MREKYGRKDKLIYLIEEKGFAAEDIGRKIGVSSKKLLRKLDGYEEFNTEEVLKLYCVLGMKAEEADSYFFPKYCETLNR